MNRKLAVILAADIAGYSRLTATDEEGTLARLRIYRATIGEVIAEHAGRIFGTAGDSVIAEFASAVQAVRASVAIQRAMARHNADLPADKRLDFRIGINLGDVMIEGEDLLGDGVNVAARLQEVAAPTGICVSGNVREQIEGKLEFPMAHLGERALKNIPRPVAVHRVDWRMPDASQSGVLGGKLALPDRPSIAVLPFTNMSGDSEQEYFADGITEDIITALSRYRWFFVIARNSTFTYKGRAVDVKQVGRELGVRYVLEGSVRKAGQRIRVTGQLIEAETGNHVWAEKYDRDFADIFAIQDEITASVVGAIEPEMLLGEGLRATRKPVENLDAFDACMRGWWQFYQFGKDENFEAERLVRHSLRLDPGLARAHVGLARLLFGRCWWGWSDDIEGNLGEAVASAARGVQLDDRDPYAHYIMALNLVLAGRLNEALAEAQRTIDISPNFALAYLALAMARNFLGHFPQSIDPLLRGLRLSPNDPLAFEFHAQLATAHYHMGAHGEALHFADRALRGRRMYAPLRTRLACLGQLNHLDECASVIAELEQRRPTNAREHWRLTTCFVDPAHRAQLVEGLAKAGWRDPGS